MSSKPELRLDWCSHAAAKYAVEQWHYSKSLPASKKACVGVWEDGRYIGCIIFSWGSNPNIGAPYRLCMTDVCELVRIALSQHSTTTSKIVSIAIRMLRKHCPGIRLIVSYADTEQGHIGTMYQALSFIYVGTMKTTPWHWHNGKWVKQRTMSSACGSVRGSKTRPGSPKIKYLLPLDADMRAQIEPLRKPYPKKEQCATSIENDAAGNHPAEGGVIPTVALQDTDHA